jgi:F-type H+-transporting ATPase subunit a
VVGVYRGCVISLTLEYVSVIINYRMAQPLHISIAAEPITQILGVTITNSILTTWFVTGLIMLAVLLFSRSIKAKGQPSRLQSLVELVIEGLYGVVESTAGAVKAKRFFPLVGSFFIFILFSNWSGLLPGAGTIGFHGVLHGAEVFIPYWRAPTADVNTTMALGLIAMIAVQIYGFKYLGFKYLKKFFDFSNPINFFVGILELISDISKVISFTFRLFGNIIAGEILILVMAMLVPYFGPTPFLALEIFVGFVQALVFLMLSTVFINMATIGHGDEHHE